MPDNNLNSTPATNDGDWSVPADSEIDNLAPPMSPAAEPVSTVPISNKPAGAALPTEPLPAPQDASTKPEPVISAPQTTPAPSTASIAPQAVQPPIQTTLTPTQPKPAPKGAAGIFKTLLIIVALVVLLLVLFVGTIMADDKGWINSGMAAKFSSLNLSSFWGGLSADPANASSQATAAMAKLNNVAYTGDLVGYGGSVANGSGITSSPTPIPSASSAALNTPTPSPTTSLNSGLNSTGTNPTPAASQDNTTPASGSNAITTPISTDPFSSSYKFNFAASGNNMDLNYSKASSNSHSAGGEFRVVGGVCYSGVESAAASMAVNSNTSSELTWTKLSDVSGIAPDQIFGFLTKKLASGQFITNESLKSERTYHFRAAISGLDIPILSVVLPSEINKVWQASNGPLDIWISRTSHQIVRFTIALTRSSDNKKVTLDATFDPTQVRGSIVAPDNVTDPAKLPKTPDEQRKADLLSIATSLEKYKVDNGAYPVSSGDEKLNQITSTLQTKLVPTYITVLPSDPNAAKYYSYSSDGTKYKLTTVLDNSADTEGTTVGNKTFYYLNGPLPVSKVSPSPSPSPSPSL